MTTPTRPLSRWHWQNWPVLVKLIGVLLVPTVVALVVGALRIVDQAAAAPGFERIIDVVGVQQELSGVVTAIQDERDLAAAYIAGGRQVGRAELEAQFGAVGAAVSTARAGSQDVAGIEDNGSLAALVRLGG
ncbi:MAG: nitrate- and nitrite sensing domain-containing protein, partial [Pseudonocardiaceae bacterium]